jgi:hypothetical protein
MDRPRSAQLENVEAQSFSHHFFRDHPILVEDPVLRSARLALGAPLDLQFRLLANRVRRSPNFAGFDRSARKIQRIAFFFFQAQIEVMEKLMAIVADVFARKLILFGIESLVQLDAFLLDQVNKNEIF